MTDAELLKSVIPVVLATSGAAWGAVKLALNGTRKAIADGRQEAKENFETLRSDVQKIDDKVDNVRERVAHLEGAAK